MTVPAGAFKKKLPIRREKQGKTAFQLVNSSVNEAKINVNDCLFSAGHYESWCRTRCWGDLLKQEKNYLRDDIPLWRRKINLGGFFRKGRNQTRSRLSLFFFIIPKVQCLFETEQPHIVYSQNPGLFSIWCAPQQIHRVCCYQYGWWDCVEQLIPLKLHEPFFLFFLASFYVSCNQICGWGSSSQPHRVERLLLCWLRSLFTQSMKSVDSRSQGPACWALHSSTRPGENGTAQSAGEGHWSDEKIIPTLPPPSVAGPHAASNHLWAVTWPDWAERIWVGNFKTCSCFCVRERICITHSDLMDFPMFAPDSPFFCWHVQIMNLLCVGSLYSPSCSWVQFLVAG